MNPEEDPELRARGFKLEFPSVSLQCYPDNTVVFTHELEPYGDHLFVFNPEDETVPGHYVFREQIENWEEMIVKMEERGYSFLPSDDGRLRPHDREAYEKYLLMKTPVELPENQLTPRQEQRIQWLGYLLFTNRITPDDFNREIQL